MFPSRQVRSKAPHGSQNNGVHRCFAIASVGFRSPLNTSTGYSPRAVAMRLPAPLGSRLGVTSIRAAPRRASNARYRRNGGIAALRFRSDENITVADDAFHPWKGAPRFSAGAHSAVGLVASLFLRSRETNARTTICSQPPDSIWRNWGADEADRFPIKRWEQAE